MRAAWIVIAVESGGRIGEFCAAAIEALSVKTRAKKDGLIAKGFYGDGQSSLGNVTTSAADARLDV